MNAIPVFQYGIIIFKKFVHEHIAVSQASPLFCICPTVFYLAREVTVTLF